MSLDELAKIHRYIELKKFYYRYQLTVSDEWTDTEDLLYVRAYGDTVESALKALEPEIKKLMAGIATKEEEQVELKDLMFRAWSCSLRLGRAYLSSTQYKRLQYLLRKRYPSLDKDLEGLAETYINEVFRSLPETESDPQT